jgi:hypothetical protein
LAGSPGEGQKEVADRRHVIWSWDAVSVRLGEVK